MDMSAIGQPIDGILYDLDLLPVQIEAGSRDDLRRAVIVALYRKGDVLQANYDNLRAQHDALLKQARAMAAILRAVAGGDDCQTEAAELLAKYADEIKF